MKGWNFTLIEMLVVIAIIGILASMLMGPIQKAIKSSRKTTCLNNLAQQGKALFLYESPNAFDAAPLRVAPAVGSEGANPTALAPYVALAAGGMLDNAKLLVCPVADGPFPVVAEFDQTTLGLITQKNTAAHSLVLTNGTTAASHYLFTLFYTRASPGSRVIAGDAGDNSASATNAFSPNHGDIATRLEEGANCLFKDGHVKGVSGSFKADGASDTGNLWNNDTPPVNSSTLTQIGHY